MFHKWCNAFLSIIWIMVFLLTATNISADTKNKLHLEWPQGWEVTNPVFKKNVMHLKARTMKSGINLADVKLTMIDLKDGPKPPTLDMVKSMAEMIANAIQKDSIEDNIVIHSLSHQEGYYFRAEDNNPKDGEFKHIIECLVLLDGHIVHITLLTDMMDSKPVKQFMKVVENMTLHLSN